MKTSLKVEDYLSGNLSTDEEIKFSAQLKEDDALAELVALYEEVNESIIDSEVEDYRHLIKDALNSKSNLKIRFIKAFTAIAAVLILTFSIVSITKDPEYSKAYATYYQAYKTDFKVRGESDKNKIDFAYLLYEKGEYQASYEILENYNQTVFDNATARFYFGICAMELAKYESAEESLLEVLQSNNAALQLHAKWYLSLLYLKTESPQKAVNHLNSLSEKENFYSKRAKRLIRKYY